MHGRQQTITIVGGGAAGYFAAINTALKAKGAKVTILEATRRPLTKVKISGGGRCNVTHHCFDPEQLVRHYPRGYRELRGAFSRFQPRDTERWFAERGVHLKVEADGRMFPVSNDSETIIGCFRKAAEEAGVELRPLAIVKAVARHADGFALTLHDGAVLVTSKLVLATGSMPGGHALAASLGHRLVPPVPSLFTFNIDDTRFMDLAGLAFAEAALELQVEGVKEVFRSLGPLLVTHWGLSGPAVLRLSAFAARALAQNAYQGNLTINFLGKPKPADVQALFAGKRRECPRALVAAQPLSAEIPRRYWQSLLRYLQIAADCKYADLSNKLMNDITDQLVAARFAVRGKGVFKDEFVTAGGVALDQVDFRTMQSQLIPGLYFAGEILDIDGVTGGFNFQAAWTTAYIAAVALANPDL